MRTKERVENGVECEGSAWGSHLRTTLPVVLFAAFGSVAMSMCGQDDGGVERAETYEFAERLSEVEIFDGRLADLRASDEFEEFELSSALFTDYADKQRLVAVPDGEMLAAQGSGLPMFPDETVLVKTFSYDLDQRDPDSERRVIETRLLVKSEGYWNVATYVWNEAQNDAVLDLDGHRTDVSWVDADGQRRSTNYEVPSENQCAQCHQQDGEMTPIGPKLRNLNRTVTRYGAAVNQLDHLQATGVLSAIDIAEISTIPDYNDHRYSLDQRARAYLEMNCSHCHNPHGWPRAADRDVTFEFSTPLSETGIVDKIENIDARIRTGQMPRTGTTMIDEDGVALLREFLTAAGD